MTSTELLMGVSSENFLSGAPERPTGVSVEYLLQPSKTYTQEELNGLLLSPEHIRSATNGLHARPATTIKNNQSVIFEDGGRMRVSTDAAILEYSTGMKSNIEQAVTADLIGMITLRDITEQGYGRPFSDGGLQRRTGGHTIYIDKDNTPHIHTYKSRGMIDILYTPVGTLESARAKDIFETFLSTHTIWSGIGMAGKEGFELSQKAPGIGEHIGSSATSVDGNKPIAMIEVYDGYDLIEARLVDAATSPWVRTMSLATKSLMLRLFEHGSPELLARLPVLVKTIDVARTISKDSSMTVLYDVVDNGVKQKMTALDIQKRYLAVCTELELELEFDKDILLPKIEQQALREWDIVLEDLERVANAEAHYAILSNRLDSAARRQRLGRTASLSSKDVFGVFKNDMLWDYLGNSNVNALSHWLKTPTVFTPEAFVRAAKASLRK